MTKKIDFTNIAYTCVGFSFALTFFMSEISIRNFGRMPIEGKLMIIFPVVAFICAFVSHVMSSRVITAVCGVGQVMAALSAKDTIIGYIAESDQFESTKFDAYILLGIVYTIFAVLSLFSFIKSEKKRKQKEAARRAELSKK